MSDVVQHAADGLIGSIVLLCLCQPHGHTGCHLRARSFIPSLMIIKAMQKNSHTGTGWLKV